MVVQLRQVIGMMLVLSLFLIITGGFILADQWWGQYVIEHLRGRGGFWGELQFALFTFALMLFASMVILSIFMMFITGFMGTTMMYIPGIQTTLITPIFVVLWIGLAVLLYMFFTFIVYHIPLVVYIFLLTAYVVGGIRDQLQGYLR